MFHPLTLSQRSADNMLVLLQARMLQLARVMRYKPFAAYDATRATKAIFAMSGSLGYLDQSS
eukprot:3576647-Amphidinium_carterae.1